jgi:hypothetical protein
VNAQNHVRPKGQISAISKGTSNNLKTSAIRSLAVFLAVMVSKHEIKRVILVKQSMTTKMESKLEDEGNLIMKSRDIKSQETLLMGSGLSKP